MYALIIFTLLNSSTVPKIEKLVGYSSLDDCQNEIEKIYQNKKSLKANYPVSVELKNNDDKEKLVIFKYKPDYTKPDELTIYMCKEVVKS